MLRTTNTETIDLGNNESLSRGVFSQADGTWLAMTFTRSRTFKTQLRATIWFNAQVSSFDRISGVGQVSP